ncbi:MAG: hypothetical protein ACT4QG_21715 [Sporichthyaceae bacterium]
MNLTGSLAAQLGVRLALIGALLTAVGVTSYGATHWEPRAYHAPKKEAPAAVSLGYRAVK